MSTKDKGQSKYRVTMSKPEKTMMGVMKMRGIYHASTKTTIEGEQNVHDWAKDGFKGAWWHQYFSRNEKE